MQQEHRCAQAHTEIVSQLDDQGVVSTGRAKWLGQRSNHRILQQRKEELKGIKIMVRSNARAHALIDVFVNTTATPDLSIQMGKECRENTPPLV